MPIMLFASGVLDSIRDFLGPWLGFLIMLVTFLAFWPRLKTSIIAKVTRENVRLRGIIADMTLEEEIKNVIILGKTRRIEQLEKEAIDQHRIQLEHISQHKNSAGPGR